MNISAQKQSRGGVGLDTISKIGIFSLLLLVTAVAVYIYSPIIKTNAATDTAGSQVNTSVVPVAGVALNTANLNLNFSSPTSEGVFDSGAITATISTNSSDGYALYFSSTDNSTNMVHESSSVSDVIASDFSGTVTSSTMAANKWGYSLDNTNFSKIPTLAGQAKIRDINHFPSASEKSNPVYIGAKVSSNLMAGAYAKSVIFSVITHGVTETMQQFDPASLASGESKALVDSRDGKVYVVAKMADGKVWMTQNLRLVGGNLTSSDTDISGTFTLPNNNWGDSLDQTDKYNNPYTYNTGNTDYGVYYNYAAATAGTITGDSNTTEAAQSICPKGWKIPSETEYANLLSAYNVTNDTTGSEIMRNTPLYFVYSGYIRFDSMLPGGQVSNGNWWSTTAYDNDSRYHAYLIASSARADYHGNRSYGVTLRCVAR